MSLFIAPEYIQKIYLESRKELASPVPKLREKYPPEIKASQGLETDENEAQTQEYLVRFIKFKLKAIKPETLINNLEAIFNQQYIPKAALAKALTTILKDDSVDLQNLPLNFIRRNCEFLGLNSSELTELRDLGNKRARKN